MWVATAAAEVLTHLGRAAVPPLIEAFEKGSTDRRMSISRVLGEIGPDASAATAMLEKAAASAPSSLRERIQSALARIKAKPPAASAVGAGEPAAGPVAGSRLLRPTVNAAQDAARVAAVPRPRPGCRLHGNRIPARLVGQRAETPLADFRAGQGVFVGRHCRRETLSPWATGPARTRPRPSSCWPSTWRRAASSGPRPSDRPRKTAPVALPRWMATGCTPSGPTATWCAWRRPAAGSCGGSTSFATSAVR